MHPIRRQQLVYGSSLAHGMTIIFFLGTEASLLPFPSLVKQAKPLYIQDAEYRQMVVLN